MNESISKLNNRHGASLMLALLVFLICALCGSVVLAAGSAAAGRIAGVKETDQSLYTLSSTAGVFRDELKTSKFYCEDTDKDTWKVTPADNMISKLLLSLAGQVQKTSGTYTETVKLSASGTDKLKEKKIVAKVTMDQDYNLTAVFSYPASEKDESTVTLKMTGSKYVTSQDKEEKKTFYVTWANPVIAAGTEPSATPGN